jgi:hypothetical protein
MEPQASARLGGVVMPKTVTAIHTHQPATWPKGEPQSVRDAADAKAAK